jgi:hypothetical protein
MGDEDFADTPPVTSGASDEGASTVPAAATSSTVEPAVEAPPDEPRPPPHEPGTDTSTT